MDKLPTVRFRGSEIVGAENLPQPRLTPTEIKVLQLLHKEASSVRMLVAASASKLKQASTRAALNGLEARGRVVLQDEPNERANTRLYSVTEEGASIAEAHDLLMELAKALARSAARRDHHLEEEARRNVATVNSLRALREPLSGGRFSNIEKPMSSNMRDGLKRRGRPTTDAKPILVRIAPDDLARLDAFRGAEADEPTRPEAIRRLIHRGLGPHRKARR